MRSMVAARDRKQPLEARQGLVRLLREAAACFDDLYLVQREPQTARALDVLRELVEVAGPDLRRRIGAYLDAVWSCRSGYRRRDGEKLRPLFSLAELERVRGSLAGPARRRVGRAWKAAVSQLFDPSYCRTRGVRGGLYGDGIATGEEVAVLVGAGKTPRDAEAQVIRRRIEAHRDRGRLEAIDTVVALSRGELISRKYHEVREYRRVGSVAARLLREAARIADQIGELDAATGEYLKLVAVSLTEGIPDDVPGKPRDWNPADECLVKIDHGRNGFCFIASPVMETYIDEVLGRKGEARAILVQDHPIWSERARRFARLLPRIESALTIGDRFKRNPRDVGIPVIVSGDVLQRAGGAWNLVAFTLPNVLPRELVGRQILGHFVNAAAVEAKAMHAVAKAVLSPLAAGLLGEAMEGGLQWKYIAHEASHNTTQFACQGAQTAVLREVLGSHYLPLEELRGECMLADGVRVASQLESGLVATEEATATAIHTAVLSPLLSNRFGIVGVYATAKNALFNYLRQRGAILVRDRRVEINDMTVVRETLVELAAIVLDLFDRARRASSLAARESARAAAGEFLARWTGIDEELRDVLEILSDYRVPALPGEAPGRGAQIQAERGSP